MSLQKAFQAKIYDQGGTFLHSFTSDVPADESLPYLKNTPEFPCRINGGFGECVLDIAYPFDDFNEGTIIDFMNRVDIYAVKTDDETLSQTIDLIYSGFISKYDPYIESSSEGVKITCLGYVSLTSASYYKSGSSFTVTHTSEDPETIGRAIVDHINTVYGGSLLSYSDDTTDPVGATVSVTFTDQKWFDALTTNGTLAGTNWWWKIDESRQFWLKAKPGVATHTFTIGKDIEQLHGEKDGENVLNDIFVRRSGGTETSYSDSASQAAFGTGSPPTGKRSVIITDSSLADAGAADQRGNKELADNKPPKVRCPFTVNANYDLESIKVGDTCKITNLKNGNTFFGDNLLIVGLTYHGDTVDLELEETSGSFGNELARFVANNSAPASTSGGGGGGSAATFVDREIPTGSVDGSNTTFTIAQTPVSSSEHVYLNGVLQNAGVDYAISVTTITFTAAPDAGSTLLISYRTSNGSTSFADREVPSGSVNGTNNAFTIAHTPSTGSEYVWLNGVLQNGSGTDYSISGSTITFTTPPDSGSIILISYRY